MFLRPIFGPMGTSRPTSVQKRHSLSLRKKSKYIFNIFKKYMVENIRKIIYKLFFYIYRARDDRQGNSLNDIYTFEEEEKICRRLLEERTRHGVAVRFVPSLLNNKLYMNDVLMIT